VVVGGDQLTHVRLAGAKELRRLSPNPVRRFCHLKTFVIEMWHTKQDLLEVTIISCDKCIMKFINIFYEPFAIMFIYSGGKLFVITS